MNFFSLFDRFDNTHGTKVEKEIKLEEIESQDVVKVTDIEDIQSIDVNVEVESADLQSISEKDDIKADDLQSTEADKFELNDIVENLQAIHGYIGSVITYYDGMVLLSDTEHMQDDFSLSVSVFNDIFRSAHKVSQELELGETENMSIIMDEGMIMMACSGEHSQSHIHIFALLNKDVNALLAKRVLDKIVHDINGN